MSAICPDGHENSEGSLFCNICGSPIATRESTEIEKAPEHIASVATKSNLWLGPVLSFVVVLTVVLLVVVVTNKGSDSTAPGPQQQAHNESGSNDKPAIPVGYTDAGNGVAVKWVHIGDDDFQSGACPSYLNTCRQLTLYSYGGCAGGGYIEANFLDSAEMVIDWTNDRVPKLASGDRYNATLGTNEPGVNSVKLTEFTCR